MRCKAFRLHPTTTPAGTTAAQCPAIRAHRLARSATGLTGIIAAFSRLTSPRPLELSHCAHAQGQSRVPMCRTVLEEYAAPAARGMQTEMPSKQAALARQVRQRMNRLGKPEHRARFCFFSKKKSLAGTRRFPIPSKSRFRWGLTAAPQASQPQKPFFNRRPSPARSANHTRWNHRRITFRHARPPAGASATAPTETTAA